MDELAVMRVSGVVLALMYLLRWAGVSHGWAPGRTLSRWRAYLAVRFAP
jgi:hypothetical protein